MQEDLAKRKISASGKLRLAFRAAILLPVGLWGVIITLAAVPFALVPRLHDLLIAGIARHWFGLLAIAFGVRVKDVGEPASGPVLVAANHVSWLDIVVLGRRLGSCFVSKSEISGWPVLGWLARQGGTLFIQRGHRDSAEHIAHAMAARLESGGRLLFFPEGTTSDGWGVIRFKPRLFVPAVITKTPVQPVTIAYQLQQGYDPAAFIDGTGFIESILGVAARPRTDVTIYWGDPIEAVDRDKRELAADAESVVVDQMAHHRGVAASKLLDDRKRNG